MTRLCQIFFHSFSYSLCNLIATTLVTSLDPCNTIGTLSPLKHMLCVEFQPTLFLNVRLFLPKYSSNQATDFLKIQISDNLPNPRLWKSP